MSNDPIADSERAAIASEIKRMVRVFDARIVLLGLICHAAILGKKLISAGLVSRDDMASFFDRAKADAISSGDVPVAITYADSGKPN